MTTIAMLASANVALASGPLPGAYYVEFGKESSDRNRYNRFQSIAANYLYWPAVGVAFFICSSPSPHTAASANRLAARTALIHLGVPGDRIFDEGRCSALDDGSFLLAGRRIQDFPKNSVIVSVSDDRSIAGYLARRSDRSRR